MMPATSSLAVGVMAGDDFGCGFVLATEFLACIQDGSCSIDLTSRCTSSECRETARLDDSLAYTHVMDTRRWPALEKDDASLREELEQLLANHAVGNPYGKDGRFAATITRLPAGLCAMAATHWLDVSLTLDSITWHFGNFGEPGLVAQTETGLRELGLRELADCFVEAKELMAPLLAERTDPEGDLYEILKRAGLQERADEIDDRAWRLGNLEPGESAIYNAWIRYTRQHPDRVFGPLPSSPGTQEM